MKATVIRLAASGNPSTDTVSRARPTTPDASARPRTNQETKMNLQEMNSDELAQAWIAAKQAEERANAQRIEVEQEIVNRFPSREEGSQTHDLPSGLKIEITGKLTYKADIEKLTPLLVNIPQDLHPIKVETKLDETGAKYLRANEPKIWQQIASAITVKPAKTAVKVKI